MDGRVDVARLGRLLALTGREARRVARHPALWLPLAVAAAGVAQVWVSPTTRFGPTSQYETVFLVVAGLVPIAAIFAANLVASSARRVRADEMLDVTPMSDAERTLATCLGVGLTLGAIGAVGAVIMWSIEAAAVGTPERLIDPQLQTAGELAQIVPIVVSGGLLGVLTARWLRFPGAILVAFAIFVVGGGFVSGGIDVQDPGRLWFPWSTAVPTLYEGVKPAGDHWWHAVYLLGLCACATVAAVYRDRTQWTRLVAVGLPVAAVTALAGWLQLP